MERDANHASVLLLTSASPHTLVSPSSSPTAPPTSRSLASLVSPESDTPRLLPRGGSSEAPGPALLLLNLLRKAYLFRRGSQIHRPHPPCQVSMGLFIECGAHLCFLMAAYFSPKTCRKCGVMSEEVVWKLGGRAAWGEVLRPLGKLVFQQPWVSGQKAAQVSSKGHPRLPALPAVGT